jgi:hypothetical protein
MTDPTINTPNTGDVGYGEMSAAELAKIINTDYGLILSSERMNLQRAKAVGEKLTWLQAKAPPKEWQKKLKEWCPKLSYETANKYIRVYVKWSIIEARAKAKNVVTTDLTLQTALELLAKPRPEPEAKPETEKGKDSEPDDEGDADDESDDEDDDGWNVAKDWLRPLAVDALNRSHWRSCSAGGQGGGALPRIPRAPPSAYSMTTTGMVVTTTAAPTHNPPILPAVQKVTK